MACIIAIGGFGNNMGRLTIFIQLKEDQSAHRVLIVLEEMTVVFLNKAQYSFSPFMDMDKNPFQIASSFK